MTVVTVGRASSQAKASSSSEWPRSPANRSRASSRAKVRSENSRALAAGLTISPSVSLVSGGSASERRYFPVSMPLASG